MKIDTLFKAQIRKMTPYAREEQKLKIAWTGQLYFQMTTNRHAKAQSF